MKITPFLPLLVFGFYAPTTGRQFFATTVPGLEQVLEKELRALGATGVEKGKAGVSFEGDTAVGCEALLWLRSALRLMEVVGYGDGVRSKEDLFAFCSSVDWGALLHSPSNTFKCECILGQDTSEDFNHSHYTSLTLKNAVVDWFRDHGLERPSVSVDDPDLSLLLYLHRGTATLYRVWSGDASLHKRGYRDVVHRAALRESTAAALLLAAGWSSPSSQSSSILCDPFCGSGTLLIEAALIAADCAPGLIRYDGFAPRLVTLPDLQQDGVEDTWDDAMEKARARDRRRSFTDRVLYGSDVNPSALQLAERSAAMAGVGHMIGYMEADANDVAYPEFPTSAVQTVVTNPPWDMRLEGGDDAWRKLDALLRRELARPQTSAYVLTGNPQLVRHISFKPTGNLAFSSSNVPMRLIKYTGGR
jgi:23S rRNA G2445 N2-methylase RlmL